MMSETHQDNIIRFPKPMAGLENNTQFRLFHDDTDNPTVHYLQSVTHPDIEMSIVVPEALDMNLEFELSDDEQALLQLDNAQDAVVAVIIYKPQQDDTTDDDQPMRVMLHAPIVINAKTKLALQKRIA